MSKLFILRKVYQIKGGFPFGGIENTGDKNTTNFVCDELYATCITVYRRFNTVL